MRFAALGDVVLLTVLINRLALRYGAPVAVLSSGGWTKTLLAANPSVSEIQLVTSRKRPYWLTPSQREAVAWLKTRKGDVYLCDPDPYSRRLVARAVPADRVIRVWDEWPGIDTHWADWWESVGTAKPLVPGSGRPRLDAPQVWFDDASAWMAAKGLEPGKVILIQPGNKKTAKRWTWNRINDKFWPIERWVSVIGQALADKPDFRAVICGAPSEQELVQSIVSGCNDARVIGAALDLPIPRLVALSARAHSMITIDTGPAHVAAAMNCPCVILFGAFGWGRWAPRAPSATIITLGNREETKDGTVMSISTDEVIAAWRQLGAQINAVASL